MPKSKYTTQEFLDLQNNLSFEGLELYFTKEIDKNDIERKYWKHYQEAYLLANLRVSSAFQTLKSFEDLPLKGKVVKVFLTTNRDLYVNILKDSGMNWVLERDLENMFGFVNNGVNLEFIDEYIIKRYLAPTSGALDGLSHEYTHILLPQYLNTTSQKEYHYWGPLFEEGIAVLLNSQYQHKYNLKKNYSENKNMRLDEITVDEIFNKGTHSVDTRGNVTKNFAYQYSAAIVESVAMELGKNNESLMSFAKDHIGKSTKDIVQDLKSKYEIDIYELEKALRKELGMS